MAYRITVGLRGRDLAQSVACSSLDAAGYRLDASSNPVVGVSMKNPSVDRQTVVCLPLPLVGSDASPWSTVVIRGWCVGL
jgi:hypothetical protein